LILKAAEDLPSVEAARITQCSVYRHRVKGEQEKKVQNMQETFEEPNTLGRHPKLNKKVLAGEKAPVFSQCAHSILILLTTA
jgi:hypothetical protein